MQTTPADTLKTTTSPVKLWFFLIITVIPSGMNLCGCSLTHAISEFTDTSTRPKEAVVQLRAATLPILGWIGIHYWYVAYDPESGEWQRWEVMHKKEFKRTLLKHKHWDYLHLDLFTPDSGVGGGEFTVRKEWRGEPADRLIKILRASPDEYPYKETYHMWPGPNSNTYVAWVLRNAGVSADMHPMAVGKDFTFWYIGAHYTTTHSGLQLETPVLGIKIGLLDGIEAHIFCFTLGIDFWLPAVKTPFGRIGFQE